MKLNKINERTAQLNELHRKFWAKPEGLKPEICPQGACGMTADEIIGKAMKSRGGSKFKDLLSGDWQSYGSQSEADQAFCNMLAFWTRKDAVKMDEVFRRSELMREKWDRKTGGSTYGEITIQEAIRACTDVYTPPKPDSAADDFDDGYAEHSFEQKGLKPLEVYTAKQLAEMDLKPPEFIVDGLIPKGIVMLAAAPKIGKSWLALDIAVSVTEGLPFLGYQSNKSDVLYLALEDSLYRLDNRLNKLMQGISRPSGLITAIESENMSNGFIRQLETFIKSNRSVKFIIIDTFQKIKPQSDKGKTAYEQDYALLAEFGRLTREHSLCILLVHHTRKSNGAEGDAFEDILGSTALQGATDAMMVIKKKKRTDEVATLYITGRDVFQQELYVYFDKAQCRWINQGTVEEIDEQRTTLYYDNDPLVKTIVVLLEENNLWEGSLLELQDHVTRLMGVVLEERGQALATRIKRLAPLLEYKDSIQYRHSSTPVKRNGKSVRLHSFQRYSVVSVVV